LKKIFILIFCAYIILILFSCDNNNNKILIENTSNENITSYSNTTEQFQAPAPKQLSDMFYPEWIFLSENFHNSTKLYSPIDHDYNIKAGNQDFIGNAAYEFVNIWREEMNFQYNKCLESMPEKYKIEFTEQQKSWQKYIDDDVFPEIAQYTDDDGLVFGEGFIRESYLIYMDKIRTRTIEIMRDECFIDGITVEFHYQ